MKTSSLIGIALGLAALAGCTDKKPRPKYPSEPNPFSAAPTAAAASLHRYEYVRPEMGTGFRIVLYSPGQATADLGASAAFNRIEQLNSILSDYDPGSELSRLSQQTSDGPMSAPMPVSSDLWNVISKSVEVSRLSDGAFDITVGPFVRLWRRSRDMRELPTTRRIEAARASVGYQLIRLDPSHHAVQLLAAHMRLDVGGIGKGYAAQEAYFALRKLGFNRALVAAAGDIYAGDSPPDHDGWVVTFQKAGAEAQNTNLYVRLVNQAVSTSGDTYRFVEIDGTRYSHVIDPRTGLGLKSRIGVSVIAPDGMTADSYCKIPSVLGIDKGLEIIERTPGVAAMVTTFDGEQPAVRESSRFADYVVQHPTTSFSALGKSIE